MTEIIREPQPDDDVLTMQADFVPGNCRVLDGETGQVSTYPAGFIPRMTRGEVRDANVRFEAKGLRPVFSETVSIDHPPAPPMWRRVLGKIGIGQ
jgi:hypothetical protein